MHRSTLLVNNGIYGRGQWGMMGGMERPWQSSSWVPTLFPAGGGVEALRAVDVWLTDTGLTVSAADRWKITIQLECDESELRAIPRISTLTVTDWWAEAGWPSPLPEWWVSYLLFTPSLVFNVGTFLTGYILFWKEQPLICTCRPAIGMLF